MEVSFRSQHCRRSEARSQGSKLTLGKKDHSDLDVSLKGEDLKQLEVKR